MNSGHAVVTGASRGIGRAIAARLASEGYRVFNLDREAPAAPDSATASIDTESTDTDTSWVEVDLSDAAAIERALDTVVEQGPVAILVNNAAIGGEMSLLEHISANDMDKTYAINVRAPALCAKRLIPSMREQGFGRIVNISSRAHLGKAYRTAYGGGKGAIVSMTKVWAIELAQSGITCNAVAPGPVRTELFEQANPPQMERTARILESIPVGRLGEPHDIAHAVSFFASREAGYVTGQVLFVCGGTTLTRGGS